MIDLKQLGMSIQSFRRAAGLTQNQLAHQAGIADSTLAKIERGAIKNPSIQTIVCLAQELKTPIESLLGIKPVSGPIVPTTVALPKKEPIKFVYSDINGVLVRFFQRAFVDLGHKAHVSPDLVESTFWHYNDAVNRGEMSAADFNKVLAERIGYKPVDWRKIYMTTVEPISAMHKCLADIAKDTKVGLLSNIFPGFIDEKPLH